MKIGSDALHGAQAQRAAQLAEWSEKNRKLPDLHKAIERYSPGVLNGRPPG